MVALTVSPFSSEKQVALGTLEKRSLWEEGRGRGRCWRAHKATTSELQMSVPGEEWIPSPPVSFFFFFFF